MNILVVCHHGLYQDLGISFVHAQTKEYVALGHRVRVLIPVAIGKKAWDLGRWKDDSQEWDGVEILPVRFLSLSNYGTGGFNLRSALKEIKRRQHALLHDFPVDVIHAHTVGFDSGIGIYLKAQTGAPLIVTTHGDDTTVPYEQGRIQTFRGTYDQADALVAVSSPLARMISSSGTSTTIQRILNGFRIEGVVPEGKRAAVSMIQVSYLYMQKRVHVTIQAFGLVKRIFPEATLTIIGEGPARPELERLCKQMGLTDSVRFLGQVPNSTVMQELSHHQFFVMPSVREGFGIVYLEAMASGCVTIGTQGEGIADFIEDGENGFLVPPDQPDVIASKIQWCLEHPQEAAQIAHKGMEAARSQTWEKNAREYCDLFSKVIKQRE